MIGKLALFALKKSPLIAGAVAAAWAGKKIYDYIEESDIIRLTPSEVDERFPKREFFPVVTCDFTNHKQNLTKIHFNKVMDDLDFLYVAFFEYQGVLFSIQRYQQSQKYHYNVYFDFVSAYKNNPDIKIFDTVEKFLFDLEFEELPLTFQNTHIQEYFTKWSANQNDAEEANKTPNKPSPKKKSVKSSKK